MAQPSYGLLVESLAGSGAHEDLFRHPLRGFVRWEGHCHGFYHGFADSPVAICRHPLRGFVRRRVTATGSTTGSRTHPWLYAVTRFAGSFAGAATTGSRTHPWLMPSPASRVRSVVGYCYLGSTEASLPVSHKRLGDLELEFFVIRKRIHAQVSGHPDV